MMRFLAAVSPARALHGPSCTVRFTLSKNTKGFLNRKAVPLCALVCIACTDWCMGAQCSLSGLHATAPAGCCVLLQLKAGRSKWFAFSF